jgi:hypothetical protein
MADIPARAPQRGWMWQAIWDEATARWQAGTYYSSGGCANEQASPDMSIRVDELVGNGHTTSAGNVSIDAAHATLARMDVLYQTAAGAFAIHKGDDAAISDPLGTYNPSTHANWQGLEAPYPKASLPAGVPLYIIFVAPAVTAIYDEDLMPIACKGPMPPPIASAGDGVSITGPVRITHDGGLSQAILTSPALCEIDSIVVQCAEAPDGTVSVDFGWAADTDALMANAEIPTTLNSSVIIHPNTELTSATAIVATVGGSGTVGEWDVWLKYSEYSPA